MKRTNLMRTKLVVVSKQFRKKLRRAKVAYWGVRPWDRPNRVRQVSDLIRNAFGVAK